MAAAADAAAAADTGAVPDDAIGDRSKCESRDGIDGAARATAARAEIARQGERETGLSTEFGDPALCAVQHLPLLNVIINVTLRMHVIQAIAVARGVIFHRQ